MINLEFSIFYLKHTINYNAKKLSFWMLMVVYLVILIIFQKQSIKTSLTLRCTPKESQNSSMPKIYSVAFSHDAGTLGKK